MQNNNHYHQMAAAYHSRSLNAYELRQRRRDAYAKQNRRLIYAIGILLPIFIGLMTFAR